MKVSTLRLRHQWTVLVLISFSLILICNCDEEIRIKPGKGKPGDPCKLTVYATGVVPAAELDGVCYKDPQADQICCQNVGAVGTSDIALANVKQNCMKPTYCCAAKAKLPPLLDNAVVNC